MRLLTPAQLDEAAEIIISGGIVAYPTETFYGLAARYDSPDALRRIAHMKGRTPDKAALPLIIADKAMLGMLMEGAPDDLERKLMDERWPGPLTMLIRARSGLPTPVVALGTVAVRVPGSEIARELARSVGMPITSTSANPTGLLPAHLPGMVIKYFEHEGLDAVIDAGPTPGGLPSTIVSVQAGGVIIVRPGACRINAAESA